MMRQLGRTWYVARTCITGAIVFLLVLTLLTYVIKGEAPDTALAAFMTAWMTWYFSRRAAGRWRDAERDHAERTPVEPTNATNGA